MKAEMEQVIREDMAYICDRTDHMAIDGSKVLISGATGLIGKYLVRFLVEYCGCQVLAVVRDLQKAHRFFKDLGDRVEYICSDIVELEALDKSVDYIIHGASMTASKSFLTQPAEVIYTSVEGTRRMLEFARVNKVKGFVYLSTMEVYGVPETEEKICEESGTSLDTMSVRTSYPESKRLCENLCTAYASEYQVPARVVRLTQTFGPGVEYEDSRVFAEFARCVIEGKDIILHTNGDTRRNYLYLADACTAVLTVMTKGISGEAYNAANEAAYCSIREMAELAVMQNTDGNVQVRIEADHGYEQKMGYAPVLKMKLDTSKLQKIGWMPETGLSDMFRRMIACMSKA